MKNSQCFLSFSVLFPLLLPKIQVTYDFNLEADFGVEFHKRGRYLELVFGQIMSQIIPDFFNLCPFLFFYVYSVQVSLDSYELLSILLVSVLNVES